VCLLGKCAVSCNRDGACAQGQTCALNLVGDTAPSPTTKLVSTCTARRASKMPGAACARDAECDRGSCQLGVCAELCGVSADCHGTGFSCAKMVALLDNGKTPEFQACLPSKATLQIQSTDGNLVVPSTARAMALYTTLSSFDFNTIVGFASLTSPSGKQLYTPPMKPNEVAQYYALPVRYQPAETDSTMLLPNSPLVMMETGLWTFTTGATAPAFLTTTAYLRLGDPPPTTGTAPLNIYFTDLSSACNALTVEKAQSGALDGMVTEIKSIFQQAGVSFSAVNFVAAPDGTPNTLRSELGPTATLYPDLDNVLRAATNGGKTSVGFDVVLVKSITDGGGLANGILGIAGGIPSSPILGSPHSGVAVSVQTLCSLGMTTFGSTSAHELGHSVGLYHSVEMDNHTDPLPDTGTEKTNVMYWEENTGTILSPQQGQVIRNDPKVQW
jgi:hypothetical protein